MKRIVLLLLTLTVFVFATSNTNGKKIAKELSIVSVLHHMDAAKKNKLQVGYMYLYSKNERLWLQKRNNEFEADEIRLTYYNELIKAAKKTKNKYFNKKLTFTAFAEFGKYDFEKGAFPVKIRTEGKKPVISLVSYGERYYAMPFLVINNLDTNNVVLKMNKNQAKKFLKSGKDRDRRLKAVFTGYVRDVKVCNTGWNKVKYIKPNYKDNRGGSSCLMFDYEDLKFTDL